MTFRRILLFLLLIVPAVAVASGEPPSYFEVTFLTTNDLHSRILPYDVPPNPEKNFPGAKGLGGAARRATVFKRVRAEMTTPVLLLDSGDTTYRSSYMARGYQGLADMAVMNAVRYDAAAPGNHDLEWTAPQLRRLFEASEFPWVCANLVYAATGETFLPPYTIKEVGGVRIAFFGLITSEGENNPQLYVAYPELGLKTLPPIEVARRLVPELRGKADIVVCLSHLGTTPDVQLAQQVPGIDAILGGHWHQLVTPPRMVSVGERTAFSLGAVPIVQAGAYGEWVGRTKLIFRRDPGSGRYTLMSCKGEMVHIDPSIPDDPEIKAMIDKMEKARKAREGRE